MKKICTVCSLKGGTGKTVSSLALAAANAKTKKTLLVDLDAQANSTISLGIDPSELKASVSDVLTDNKPAKAVIVQTDIKNLDLLPSNIKLAVEMERLYTKVFREALLAKALKKISKDYELILIDCAPSLNVLTINALFAGDFVLIPCQTSRYGLDGLADLLQKIQEIKDMSQKEQRSSVGILLTQFDKRNSKTNEWVMEQLQPFQPIMFKAVINRNEALNQAVIAQQSIFAYDPNSQGAQDYTKLSKELSGRMK
jgi:chromosome partitioning protein